MIHLNGINVLNLDTYRKMIIGVRVLDKYEYRARTDQMLQCVEEKAYDRAAEIAATIDWRKVKNASMICTVSDIYEKIGNIKKSRDILFIAYDRAPGSRKIVYKLGTLAIKLGDVNEATDCYEEFIKIAPKDPNQHILKYKILKAQKVPVEQQIVTLEEFKKAEYIEKWAYELAKLYDEAGMTSECLEECDDLILWFSEGRYVYQAMELKMRYKPLTPLQQEKFNQRVEEPEEEELIDAPKPRVKKEDIPELVIEESTEQKAEDMQGEELEIEETAAAEEEEGDLNMDDRFEPSVTGQMKIEEILKEWEAKQRENAKIIQETKEKAEAQKQKSEAIAEAETQVESEPESILSEEVKQLIEEMESGVPAAPEVKAVVPDGREAAAEEVVENKGAVVEELEAEAEFFDEDEPDEVEEVETEAETEDSFDEVEEFYDDEEVEFFDEEEAGDEAVEVEEAEEIEEEEEEIPKAKKRELPELDDREIEEPEEAPQKSPGGVTYDTGFVVQGRYDLSATSEIGLKVGLTEEQKQLFSYFVPVRGMSEQLFAVLESDKHCKNRYGTSRTGNLLVIGRKGSGKTVLAVDVVKAIQKQRKLKQGKVAIVTGEALNSKDLSNVVKKLHGGAIIIENAGKLQPKKIKELNDLMEEQTGELFFVLEDQRKALERVLTPNPSFKKKFSSRLELPVFINDELVTFAQIYAKENGYMLDEMGILALYSRIDLTQREDHAVTVAEVKDMMDAAIAKSQKANVKSIVKRVFGKNTDESDRIILHEQDFKD